MALENEDVKPVAESSAATQTDVKPTFDSVANAMIEKLSGPSPEENAKEGDVLKKNTTEKEKPLDETAKAAPDEEVKKEQEEPEKKDPEETEEEQTAAEVVGETKEPATEAKHEEAVPYARFKEINEKASRYEKLAADQESLITYCQQNQIPPEQFRGTLEILSLANTNPSEAIKRTEAFLEQLKVANGTGLPADLAREVSEAEKEFSEGNMSESRLNVVKTRMKELAKARIQHSNLEQQTRFAQMQQQQTQQQEFLGALSAWAVSKQTLDPSFKPKQKSTDADGKFEDFMAKNAYLWAMKAPSTIAEAVAHADKALAEVNAMIKRYQPAPKARKAPLSTGHSRSTESELPKSMDDVVNRVAKKHGYSV